MAISLFPGVRLPRILSRLTLMSVSCAVIVACQSMAGPANVQSATGLSMTDKAATAPAGTITAEMLRSAERLPVDEIVYFMLPDRFENGDPTNDRGGVNGTRLDHGFDPTAKGFYQGGDLKGLTSRLDYIQGLGVTAIWLGPIFKNKPVQGGPGQESSGYHGYWITDFTKPDPHLGTEADLKAFVDAAHARGLKVYMDIITNHTADVIAYRECHDPDYAGPDKVTDGCKYRSIADYPFTTDGGPDGPAINDGFLGDATHVQTPENFARLVNPNYAYTPYIPAGEEAVKHPAWLNDLQYYSNRGETTWSGESSLWGDFSGLDDLLTSHPVVVDGMIDIFQDWITDYGIDGFRIDTTRHVNPEFWLDFLPAMNEHAASLGNPWFYQFGEVYDPDPGALARFTRVDGFDQVLDFGFQSAVFAVVSGQEPTARLNKMLRLDDVYGKTTWNGMTQPTFLGNHDMGRFSGMLKQTIPGISQDELLARTKLGHGLMMFMRGVPVIYSGDEQGFVSDGNDQLAREPLFPSQTAVYNDNDLIGTDATTADSNFDQAHPLYRYIAEMAAIRQAHAAFRRGAMETRLFEVGTNTDSSAGMNVRQFDAQTGTAFAFSRFDPVTGQEYLVVINTGGTERLINVRVEPDTTAFTALSGDCPTTTSTMATASVRVPAFSLTVCQGNGRAERHVR
ncbi:alpha-amylase family glycosyl hydrolase [Algimonas porphyrae]|uniref:Alpha-amylase n=1 Tax=Algimonas porphyrae TaxID=1128113 RepID=A0ABQ5V3Y2_9PROT|nr:alpha-amylase family glycosyl hydrolase [Algimonas porphyrae]GLQ21762.1 alpha-amylase [Algimonas porphyrae]